MNAVTRDYWPTHEWQTAAPDALGMRPDRLRELDRAIAAQYGSLLGIVVVRQGYIVFEKYHPGVGPQDTHPVASVTKSFTSALVGIAVGDAFGDDVGGAGSLQDVDQKVVDFFPEYAPANAAGPRRLPAVTLRHLLTMTAPIAWQTGPQGREPLDRLCRQRDWVPFILDLIAHGGPPGKFQYSSATSHLLSAILTRATGLSAREFANRRLFGPIGMSLIPDIAPQRSAGHLAYFANDAFAKTQAGWLKDPQGISIGGWGLFITPRDMARFGFLYLNQGVWEGQQIVPQGWVAASTAPNANGYGYQWWLKPESFAASGFGGSHIFCVPGQDLVVAIASTPAGRSRDRWLLLDQYILPAIMD